MKGFVLMYAVFHPTIKIMDDDIDLAGAVAMTGLGLSGWEKREFSSLSFSHAVRKPVSRCVSVCLDKSVSLYLYARVLDHLLY